MNGDRIRRVQRVRGRGITRRQALKGLGAIAGAGALGPMLAACGDDDPGSASPLAPEELDIETVVVVMMENRSFDHYFGSLSLEEGRAVDGLFSGLSNPRPDGTPVEIHHLPERCVADPPHGWSSSRLQVNGGSNDGFVREHYGRVGSEHADEVMGYLRRSQLPFSYALSDEFVLCDRWFCSVLGPTWPNRMFLHAAQSNGQMNNDFPPVNGFLFPTLYDRLDAVGIDWKYYFSDLPFLALWKSLNNQLDRLRPLAEFLEDARSGSLPPVCVVDPAFTSNDDHPPHDVSLGQAFLSAVVHALGQSPQWARSILFLTYDEHGGFFDHVAPPTVEDERASEGFDQLGVRVPGLVVSPFARRGFTSSTQYEHCSVPAFIEWLYGLEPLTVRDANANIFLDAIDADRVRRGEPRPFPALPVIEVDPDVPPECLAFTGGGAQDIEQLADAGRLASELDLRAQVPDTLRAINQALLRMGAARIRKSPPR